jgi:hypothetical protein
MHKELLWGNLLRDHKGVGKMTLKLSLGKHVLRIGMELSGSECYLLLEYGCVSGEI